MLLGDGWCGEVAGLYRWVVFKGFASALPVVYGQRLIELWEYGVCVYCTCDDVINGWCLSTGKLSLLGGESRLVELFHVPGIIFRASASELSLGSYSTTSATCIFHPL